MNDSHDDLSSKYLNPPSMILHQWYSDPAFLSEGNEPVGLRLDGVSPTFSDLCSKYAGDIPASAIKSELLRVGAIKEVEGVLYPTARYYMPHEFDDSFAKSMIFSLSNLARTLSNNAVLAKEGGDELLQKEGLFERYIWSNELSSADIEQFKLLAERKADELLSELDEWVGKMEHHHKNGASTVSKNEANNDYVGLGLYIFEKR